MAGRPRWIKPGVNPLPLLRVTKNRLVLREACLLAPFMLKHKLGATNEAGRIPKVGHEEIPRIIRILESGIPWCVLDSFDRLGRWAPEVHQVDVA